MPFFVRAAVPAATFLCGAALIGTSAPGFAQKLDSVPVTAFNALTTPPVPGPIPAAAVTAAQDTPKLQPAIVQEVPEAPADDAGEIDAPAQDAPDFASLADAVAAQDHAIEDDGELRCLASGVYYESKGEPLAGQLAVAKVILNRTRSGRFPRSVCGVLTQRGQFSFVRGGVVPNGAGRHWQTAVAVAKVARHDLWGNSAASNALYFHASRVSPGWRRPRVATIGNHVFYR